MLRVKVNQLTVSIFTSGKSDMFVIAL